MKSKRSEALATLKRIIRDSGVTTTFDYYWDRTRLKMEEYLLENGYQNEGTRTCIINQAAREYGIARPRDTYRTRIYKIEDSFLYPLITHETPYYTMKTPLVELQELMEGACVAIGLKDPPKLGLTPPNARRSVAVRDTNIELSEAAGHLIPAILFHELAHIYCHHKRLSYNHDGKFFAVQLAIVVRMGYASKKRILEIMNLIDLAKKKVPFDTALFHAMLPFD